MASGQFKNAEVQECFGEDFEATKFDSQLNDLQFLPTSVMKFDCFHTIGESRSPGHYCLDYVFTNYSLMHCLDDIKAYNILLRLFIQFP